MDNEDFVGVLLDKVIFAFYNQNIRYKTHNLMKRCQTLRRSANRNIRLGCVF